MDTPENIIWSEQALENIRSIILSISQRWGSNEIDHFLEIIRKRVLLISDHPRAFSKSNKYAGYRRSVLNKRISIYYKFQNGIITIGAVFDNRQDPKRLHLAEEEAEDYATGS